ncbi:MAG: Asp-tRNA(Asn)/Glu-tRNA(Gln) amidotransferase subunit GatC [candidate division Zixibacteria bacterium]
MPILKEQISPIATLSRLKLTPSEIEKYSHELSQILDYFEKIASVNTENIDIEDTSAAAYRPLRGDKTTSSLTVEEALKNAPAQKDNYFMVPRVI